MTDQQKIPHLPPNSMVDLPAKKNHKVDIHELTGQMESEKG
jgi:hypothetical protein